MALLAVVCVVVVSVSVDSMGSDITDSRSLESDFSEGGTDDVDLRRL